tara:strand:- start:1504 stop:2748 length:1245 start_codon:yes stop_codon:yes gene_type:complete
MSNDYEVEAESAYINSLDSDGFTVSGSEAYINSSSNTYVAWAWKGGTTATQSGTHTYELGLELTDDYGDGWGDFSGYTTPQLKVYEGTAFLGDATITYEETGTQHYTIKTNNKDAIKIVWDYDSLDGGTLGQQGATLKDGSTVIQTAWTTSDTVVDGEVWITQSTTSNESTTGTLATGAPTTYPESNYNAAAGFSIATYTGNDYDNAGTEQTVNHNLGVAPEMVIVKGRTDEYGSTIGWGVYHKDLTTDFLLYLNSNAAEAYPSGGISYINNIGATSVDFAAYYGDGFNYGGDLSYPADDFVAYFFASVDGYSKVGSINSSSSSAFCFLGFRPSLIICKRSDSTGSWLMFDDKREGYNVDNDDLMANSSAIEATTDHIDILSNGFKIRTSDSDLNAGTVIYYAVGQSSKYASAR